jgi:hypothetical protein
MKQRRFSTAIYPWSIAEQKAIQRLNSPEKIQAFLDSTSYNKGGRPWWPSDVLAQRNAHCFDGALFAASVLGFHGEPPLILDMVASQDDDHILTIFRQGKYYGAISKSNYVGLRFREPIFRNTRELVLSYFESYYNHRKQKSLRGYSQPFDLRRVRGLVWDRKVDVFEQVAQALFELPHKPLLSPMQERALSLVDNRSFSAGLVGAL